MPLSWNEIKIRAIAFSKEWEKEDREDAEAKSFWDGFFHVFGISRRRVATFEQQVKLADARVGFIDLLWKGVILVEHKSRGKNLEKAFSQAKDYFPGLHEKELPRYILVSDFERFRLYDLDSDIQTEFRLSELVQNVHLFSFIAGYQQRIYQEQDPVNIEAAELMGRLHDKLKAIGYEGHQLELYLVRLLFCLFADDTNIFDRGIFHEYLELKTAEDGSDLAAHISQLFQLLNTAPGKRLKNLDEALQVFPYVNGRLFEEYIPLAHFDSGMRRILLDSCLLDWGKISPAIFGSLFQSVMDEKARRNLGAHYTSEKNILKAIKPLFLDDLWAEFEKVKTDAGKLKKLHEKISKLRFLDPACGCGNFLIIGYRELRLLELEIVLALLKGQQVISVNDYFLVDVDQFYGIEYEEFPSQVAQVAMWLMDHQMNQQASVKFGEYYKRIPLKRSATIIHGNALGLDWQELLHKERTIDIRADETNVFLLNEPEVEYQRVNIYTRSLQVNPELPAPKSEHFFNFIMGNPPFIGKQMQGVAQKQDMEVVMAGIKGAGVLDYVCAWYIKAAQYMQASNASPQGELPKTKTAFVSTNSISQGEQVGILWQELYKRYDIKIHFAHRTFRWGNEARGNAAVHVVIIGFANFDAADKRIFEYEDIGAAPLEIKVKNINPYLVEGKDIILLKRKQPICIVPEISFGSMPNDGGNFLFTDEERTAFLLLEPLSEKFFRPLISAHEFLNGHNRWCLWLKDALPNEINTMKYVKDRVQKVKALRLQSNREATRKLASFPTLFGEDRQPDTKYILIPLHSSENRDYIPLAYLDASSIANNSCSTIGNADLFHLGVLFSKMHVAWIRTVCGRIKSDYRYSNEIVYNNFPWPQNPADKQKQAVEVAAQAVLDIRTQFAGATLADLYNPLTMPSALVKAHHVLDKAVDLCYRPQPFANETKRIEFLFGLYAFYVEGLFGWKRNT